MRAGPLRRAIDGFAAWLAIEGYACRSAAAKLRIVGNLSAWLEREELGVEALDEQRVEAFLLARGPNSGRRGKATTGRQLLCYLRGSGVIPAAVSRPCSLKLKESAMAKTTPSQLPPNRYRPDDEVLAFLNSL